MGCVKEKIDRVLYNYKFITSHSACTAIALRAISFDHSPILTDICPEIHRRELSLKNENRDNYKYVVLANWNGEDKRII